MQLSESTKNAGTDQVPGNKGTTNKSSHVKNNTVIKSVNAKSFLFWWLSIPLFSWHQIYGKASVKRCGLNKYRKGMTGIWSITNIAPFKLARSPFHMQTYYYSNPTLVIRSLCTRSTKQIGCKHTCWIRQKYTNELPIWRAALRKKSSNLINHVILIKLITHGWHFFSFL